MKVDYLGLIKYIPYLIPLLVQIGKAKSAASAGGRKVTAEEQAEIAASWKATGLLLLHDAADGQVDGPNA